MTAHEQRVAAVMNATGMDKMQAIRHLQQRDELVRRRRVVTR